jgi:hypothetical protein
LPLIMRNLGATIRFRFVFTRQSGSVMVINSRVFSRQPNDGADVEFNQTGIELRPVVHEEPGTVKTYLYRDL